MPTKTMANNPTDLREKFEAFISQHQLDVQGCYTLSPSEETGARVVYLAGAAAEREAVLKVIAELRGQMADGKWDSTLDYNDVCEIITDAISQRNEQAKENDDHP